MQVQCHSDSSCETSDVAEYPIRPISTEGEPAQPVGSKTGRANVTSLALTLHLKRRSYNQSLTSVMNLERAALLADSIARYGNPAEILWQRLRRHSLLEFRVVDRRSGVACFCRPDAHRMFGEVWFDRDYDVPELPLRSGDMVLDIGGNQGFFACYAAWHGCRVVTLEPDAENLVLLKRNVEVNGFADRVTTVAAAVKGESGRTRLFRTEQLGGGMHTTIPRFAETMGFASSHGTEVPAVTVREILGKYAVDRIRLCKLDCEGAELEIIESLTTAEMNRIDAFALEFHREAYPVSALVAALDRHGSHHIFPAARKPYCSREILYALSRKVVSEIA